MTGKFLLITGSEAMLSFSDIYKHRSGKEIKSFWIAFNIIIVDEGRQFLKF